MLQTEFDHLLDSLRENDRSLLDCFAGESVALSGFLDSLKTADAQAAEMLLVEHNCRHHKLDNRVVAELGLLGTKITDLECGAPTHNLMTLFGHHGTESLFEQADRSIAIRGIENTCCQTIDRLIKHWQVWKNKNRRVVLFSHALSEQTRYVKSILENFGFHLISIPALKKRQQDVPFEIHRIAQSFSGGLDQFELEAVNRLAMYDWESDVYGLEFVISQLYQGFHETDEILVSKEQVDIAISNLRATRGEKLSKLGSINPTILWQKITETISEADSRCMAIIGSPFFARNNMPNIESPLKTTDPELRFLRLVSWAYTTLWERSFPNMKIAISSLHVYNMEKIGLTECRDNVQKLRTFFQHSMEFSSAHDQQTLATTNEWFRNSIGRSYPEHSDYEPCANHLLDEIHTCVFNVVEFLRNLQSDELGEATIVKQWKRERETTWPKYKIETLVSSTVKRLARSDLSVRAITDQLLKEIQQRLSVAAVDSNLEQVVVDIVEHALSTKFKMSMPVNAKDIIALGVEPGQRLGEILKDLREKFEGGMTNKESLLEEARKMI